MLHMEQDSFCKFIENYKNFMSGLSMRGFKPVKWYDADKTSKKGSLDFSRLSRYRIIMDSTDLR